jgi:very-short-patch-repair endonuclease
MSCKICGFNHKNNLSLARHLKFSHNISLIDYKIKYDNFQVLKCICGKNRKYVDGVRFKITCGNEKCANEIRREKRLKFMKENPDQTAWRKKNLSYPEKLFIKLIKSNELDKRFSITRERPVFPYFIDFAFDNVKVAVEIDGSQHELPNRKESDNKKDELLKENNWRVYRITAKEIMREGDEVIRRLNTFIDSDKIFENCGIKIYKTLKQQEREMLKKQKLIELHQNNGLTIKKKENCLSQRKVERPPFEQLEKEIKELGYSGVGRKYGVSDNAIRKWIKTYKERKF